MRYSICGDHAHPVPLNGNDDDDVNDCDDFQLIRNYNKAVG
jgi:hypothetical protein